MVSQLLAHAIGDYGLQSDWMALNKQRSWLVCILHCLLYTVPFYLFFFFGASDPTSWAKLGIIFYTHYLIDHFSLTKYFIKLRNRLFKPKSFELDAELCEYTGLSSSRPEGLCWFVYIVTDNMFHLVINYYVLLW